MAEQQVTADGETRPLPDPFLLLATENPIEYEGTFPLPEAQLDRFFVKTALGYPTADEELRIVDEQLDRHPLGALAPVVTVSDVERLRRSIHRVFVHEAVARWIVELMRATRGSEFAAIGSSVRGTLALSRGVRAWAILRGRRYVVPQDVEARAIDSVRAFAFDAGCLRDKCEADPAIGYTLMKRFVPIVVHRIFFKPSFLAEARERGWAAASADVRAAALERAPRPGLDLVLEGVPPTAL